MATNPSGVAQCNQHIAPSTGQLLPAVKSVLTHQPLDPPSHLDSVSQKQLITDGCKHAM